MLIFIKVTSRIFCDKYNLNKYKYLNDDLIGILEMCMKIIILRLLRKIRNPVPFDAILK